VVWKTGFSRFSEIFMRSSRVGTFMVVRVVGSCVDSSMISWYGVMISFSGFFLGLVGLVLRYRVVVSVSPVVVVAVNAYDV